MKDRQKLGEINMIEIYLFINPLGATCLQTEKRLLALIAEEDRKIQLRMIPFLNLHTVHSYLQSENLPSDNIKLRNELFETMYSASLDFKTIQLQGKKKGRTFLLKLQEAVGTQQKKYSQKLVDELIQTIDIDQQMFYVDRQSKLVKQCFENDQRTAHEMGIVSYSSAVVFNYSCERDYGVLVEDDCSSSSIFRELFKSDKESCLLNFETTTDHSYMHTRPYLHILRR